MARRLLSHLLITLAIFTLVATFYIWFLDSVILNPGKLVPVLKDAGVPSAIATLLPEKATQDAKPEERAEMKAKIAQVVTPEYVNTKMTAIATSVTTFMRDGEPQPVVDLSDFPTQLRASGIEVGSDIDKTFSTPIELNKQGNLDKLPQAYKTFKLLKIAGIVLFAVLLIAEWFAAARGEKLKRVGRIFLHTSIWFFVFWGAIVLLPSRLLPQLKQSVNDTSVNQLIDAVANAVKHLFGDYFVSFAVICGIIAIILYVLRKTTKHVQEIQAVPAARQKPTSSTKPVKK